MSEMKIGGRYEIRKELGRGGMGTVHLAFDTRLEREVALKVLDDSFTSGPEASARFEREAKTVAALEHYAIVSMYDYGEDGDFGTYLVMHLMQGGALQDRIRQGPLDPAEALKITERLAGALDKAHSRGIVHRDLKPANVMFDEEGEAYLGDFGIIKDEAGESFTRTGMPVGTPHYMSPEQAKGQPDIDGRSDIYTLGIVLYEMLAGSRPFVHEHDSFSGLLMMHLSDPVPNILEARPELPAAIQGVIEKAMAKSPEDRFSTAKALSDAAKAAFSGQATPAGESAAPAQPAPEIASTKAETKADAKPEPRPETASTVKTAAAVEMPTAAPAAPLQATAPAKKGLPKWAYVIIAVVVIGIIGLVAILSSGGGDFVEVIIVNETGTEICEVYVEEDNDFDLWENWLDDPPLLPGEGLPVYVSADVSLYIEVIGCDGSEIRDDFGEIFASDDELILR